jgi:serine/threonine protein kinase
MSACQNQDQHDTFALDLPQDIVVGESYRIKGLLGSGGMGNVYRAEHIIIGKDYALKMLAPEKITEENWKRFLAEGKAIGRLDHRHIVRVFNMGVDGTGYPYYVMDLLDGVSLHDLIKSNQTPDLHNLLSIFTQIASALNYAHSKEVIHRDIKPSNIMLIESRAVKSQSDFPDSKYDAMLVDFGIAKIVDFTEKERQQLTATGQIFGTPLYMSPEQCLGKILDRRTDIYSFGCALFETLCGSPPFRGSSATETVMMHLEQEPPTLREASGLNYSAELEALVSKLLEKDREKRYQNMEEVLHDLERISENKTISSTIRSIGFENIKEVETTTTTTQINRSAKKDLAIILYALGILILSGLLFSMVLKHTAPLPSSRNHESDATGGAKIIASNSKKSTEREEFDLVTPKGEDEDILVAKASKPKEREKRLEQVDKYLASKKIITSSVNPDASIKEKIIHCPPFVVGRFRTSTSNIADKDLFWGKKEVTAKGDRPFPSDKAIVLCLDRTQKTDVYVWARPQLLHRFEPTLISGIQLSGNGTMSCDEIMQSLSSWNDLRYVDLTGVTVSKAGLKSIDDHHELTKFSVSGSCINAEQIEKCSFLKRIYSLSLEYFPNVNSIVTGLEGNSHLQALYLYKCGQGLSAEALTTLGQCKSLHLLSFTDCPISDDQLKTISEIPQIQTILLNRCPALTKAGLQSIKSKRPDLHIDEKVVL